MSPVDKDRLSDEELYNLVQSQDMDALGVIYTRYVKAVSLYISVRLSDKALVKDIEDIVQNSFMELLNSNDRFDPKRGKLLTYICMKSVNKGKKALKNEHKNSELSVLKNEVSYFNLQHKLEDIERSKILIEAVNELPYDQRNLVMLLLKSDLTLKEISKLNSENEKTVRSRYLRTCNLLKEKISFIYNWGSKNES